MFSQTVRISTTGFLFFSLSFLSIPALAKTWTPKPLCEDAVSGIVQDGTYTLEGIAAEPTGGIFALYLRGAAQAFVAKYNQDGKLDTKFGNGGYVAVVDNGRPILSIFLHRSVSGQIYVGGGQYGKTDSFLLRLTDAGKIDNSFNPTFPHSPYPGYFGAVTSVLSMKDGALYVADSLSHIYSLDSLGQRVATWNDKGVLTLPTPPVAAGGKIVAEQVSIERLLSYPADKLSGFQFLGSYSYVRSGGQSPISYYMMGCTAADGGHCYRNPQRYSEMRFYVPEVQSFTGPFHQGNNATTGGYFYFSGSKVVDKHLEMAVARLNWDQTLDGKFGDHGIVSSSFRPDNGFYFSEVGGSTFSRSRDEFVSVGDREDRTAYYVWKTKGDGAPAAGFGDAGQAMVAVPDDVLGMLTSNIVLADDGSVLVAGRCGTEYANQDACVVRILPNGKLDTTFHKKGFISAAESVGSFRETVNMQSAASSAGRCRDKTPKLIRRPE